jgi:hypothetical protein
VCSEPQRCACDSGGGVCGARALGCELTAYGLGVTYANWSCSYRINQLERSGRDHESAEQAVISSRDSYRVIV